MTIYLGQNRVKDIYLGSNKVKEIYLGNQLVYSGVKWRAVFTGSCLLYEDIDYDIGYPSFGLREGVPTQVSANIRSCTYYACGGYSIGATIASRTASITNDVSNIPWNYGGKNALYQQGSTLYPHTDYTADLEYGVAEHLIEITKIWQKY